MPRSALEKFQPSELERFLAAIDDALTERAFVILIGGTLRWRIHAFSAWVARVDLSREGPPVLLADHKTPTGPQLVYRVAAASFDGRFDAR